MSDMGFPKLFEQETPATETFRIEPFMGKFFVEEKVNSTWKIRFAVNTQREAEEKLAVLRAKHGT